MDRDDDLDDVGFESAAVALGSPSRVTVQVRILYTTLPATLVHVTALHPRPPRPGPPGLGGHVTAEI